MNVLLDLDGTLTDTNDRAFEDIKYGRKRQFRLEEVSIHTGATNFVRDLKSLGHHVTIISDSHDAYVGRIAAEIFNVPCLSLADKPNTSKLRAFLREQFSFEEKKTEDDFLMVGDTNLDVHVARGLKIPSVLLDFGHCDGTNDSFNRQRAAKIKYGATYHCKSYAGVIRVLNEPANFRLVLEDKAGTQAARLLNQCNRNGGYTMFRGLARQHQGLCDRFGALQKYQIFQSNSRSETYLTDLAKDVSRFLAQTISAEPKRFTWDYITCVPSKFNTIPSNKMENFLNLIEAKPQKVDIFSWSSDVNGSIRHRKTENERHDFVDNFVSIRDNFPLNDKSVIILDDQFTTGATAKSLTNKLLSQGVRNILFVTLFYLVNDVAPEKKCPNCGKTTQVKYNSQNGGPFFSCTPPKFNGQGCGWTESI